MVCDSIVNMGPEKPVRLYSLYICARRYAVIFCQRSDERVVYDSIVNVCPEKLHLTNIARPKTSSSLIDWF